MEVEKVLDDAVGLQIGGKRDLSFRYDIDFLLKIGIAA